MFPYKYSAALVTAAMPAVAVAQMPTAPDLDVQYQGAAPINTQPLQVQVGDRIIVTVEGQQEITGRRFECIVHSEFDQTHKRKCRKRVETHKCPNPCQRTYKGRLFEHFYPALSVPDVEKPLEVRADRLEMVVRRAGQIRLTDLVVPDTTIHFLAGKPGGEINAQDREAIEQCKRQLVAARHRIVGISDYRVTPATLTLRVRIWIHRVQ